MPVCIENYDCFYDPIPSLYKQLRQVKNPLSKDLRTHSYFIPSRGGVFLLPPLALLLLLYRLQLAQRRKRDAFRCSANVIHPCRFSCKSAKETASYIIIHIFPSHMWSLHHQWLPSSTNVLVSRWKRHQAVAFSHLAGCSASRYCNDHLRYAPHGSIAVRLRVRLREAVKFAWG